jgi:chaperonin GroES
MLILVFMAIQPLQDRVLLQGLEPESVTKSGIYIPETATKDRPFIYTVISVWPGKKNNDGVLMPLEIQRGDKVICGQYSGDEVEYEGQKYKLVAADYILARVS